MHRVFEKALHSESNTIELKGEEANHLFVRRLQAGETIEIINGTGGVAQAEIVLSEKRKASLKVNAFAQHPPASPQIILVQALPKSQKLEWITQKATELGANVILPVETEFAEVRISDREKGKQERRLKIVIEACKQSGNPWRPECRTPITFRQLLAELPSLGQVFLAEQSGELPELPSPTPDKLCICIGPEGGFSEREQAALREAGAIPLRLGPHILRTETAAVAGLTALQMLSR